MAELFSILTYDYNKAQDILDIPDTYTPLASVSADREAGVYELGLSVSWTFDRTTNSAFIRFSIDDGVTWNEFEAEPKDKTNINATYYAFPHVHSGGAISMEIEAKKETGAGALDVQFADVWIQRVN